MQRWNFVKKENNKLIYFKIPSFEKTGIVKHCFTTRVGGISPPPYKSLNLGTKTDDNWENIKENYNIICSTLEIKADNLVISDQVHKDNIFIVDKEHRGNGLLYDKKISEVDALITNQKEVALVTLYADCVPLFIFDQKKHIIALAHAGWKGTVKKIGKKVIQTMNNIFESKPKDCLIGIGPSIGQCCYEVDKYVISKFEHSFKDINKFTKHKTQDKFMLDLWEANKISFEEIGIPRENITISNICTKCNNELFYSYRAENGKTGRMAAILQLI